LKVAPKDPSDWPVSQNLAQQHAPRQKHLSRALALHPDKSLDQHSAQLKFDERQQSM